MQIISAAGPGHTFKRRRSREVTCTRGFARCLVVLSLTLCSCPTTTTSALLARCPMRRQHPAAMSSRPSREMLEAMKRPDLQKLCKASVLSSEPSGILTQLLQDFGLRANLKSEELIEMILKAPEYVRGLSLSMSSQYWSSPATSEVPAAPQPRATSVAATRKDGTRFRERSTGSMIVHDDSGDEAISPAEDPHGASEPDPTAGRSTRTRKGKDTQSRSGVGRPAAGGVSGGRVSTRAKSRRGKARSFPTTAVPIPEGKLIDYLGGMY
ncbi:hypothetical protein OE88DRAFT_100549 [Heliocybe sulcata]|uniref:Uncharacterized protein n=1 Tax=Heliocybe sulcata TaxID=5364 RepID=A0A5C3NL02_9AGAM|nr:hypothetical protein OE88DRAFT_100549 [Heliocybe sulcata]